MKILFQCRLFEVQTHLRERHSKLLSYKTNYEFSLLKVVLNFVTILKKVSPQYTLYFQIKIIVGNDLLVYLRWPKYNPFIYFFCLGRNRIQHMLAQLYYVQ